MLVWEERHMVLRDRYTSEPEVGSVPSLVWFGSGGGGMAVIASKADGYHLTGWWTGTKGKGQLTPTPPNVYPTLEAAQAEANRLIFDRTSDWTRLLETLDDAS